MRAFLNKEEAENVFADFKGSSGPLDSEKEREVGKLQAVITWQADLGQGFRSVDQRPA